jgi:alpha-beta hydrolase superfamily lysophospholipase
MKSSGFNLHAADGSEFHVYEWLPDSGEIAGILQIAHGMAEHGKRYEPFAEFLTQNNFAVYANDHRGHGKTAGDITNVGFLGSDNGWDLLVSDCKLLGLHLQKTYTGIPHYVFGHSMGSLVVRNLIMDPGMNLNGAILSGTAFDPGILGFLGLLLTRVILSFNPGKSASPFMNRLVFGAFNKSFVPNRTKFDWLSRDNEQVDKYIKDPYCGGVFSIRFFNDFLTGLIYVSKQRNMDKMSPGLPVLIFSGDKDPAGHNGKGVTEVYNKFKKAGMANVTLKLFPDGRHEMLNEINRDEVYGFILDWLLNMPTLNLKSQQFITLDV